MGVRFSAPVQTGPGAHPAYCTMGKARPGHDADLSPPSSAVVMKESYTSTPPMGHTACTEPQCLYKGALSLLYLFGVLKLKHVDGMSRKISVSFVTR